MFAHANLNVGLRPPPVVSALATCNKSRRRLSCRGQSDSSKTAVNRVDDIQNLSKDLDTFLAQAIEERELEDKATALVEQATSSGSLQAFGNAHVLPKRIYTIDELRLNKIEPEKLLSPKDESLNGVRNIAQAAAFAGLGAVAYFSHFDVSKILGTVLATSFVLVFDQVSNAGGGEALIIDTLGRLLKPSYGQRVALHESGHFLVAYLMGILPKVYTLSSLDAFLRYRALNVQAGCQFCDRAFEREVASGRLSSSMLDKYSCVALAGVVTEYLKFGQAEGGVGDVAQLDRLFQALQFTQKKADAEVRWAVLNVAAILRRHEALHAKLADAMVRGESVAACIALIEEQLEDATDI
eukprot:jgi/Chrzof1/14646/Cz09g10190.t1